MILEQYYLGCLAHASYLLGDKESGIGVVVDPQRDIDRYLEEAARHSFEIKYVFLSHFHADFLAGHLELRDRVGAKICLGDKAEAEYEITPFEDGEELSLGNVKMKILHTPGHSPESICIAVYDLAKDEEQPHAVLTGDTLFIGDVGRPDLRASLGWTADDLGALLYDSLHQKLMTFPDDRKVAVHCASGYRSCVALSLLEPKLGNSVMNLVGGLAAWEAAGLETVSSSEES